jgi:hypothetical protein
LLGLMAMKEALEDPARLPFFGIKLIKKWRVPIWGQYKIR